MTAAAQGEWRNQHLDWVYPFAHLLAEFSALEQVVMPPRIRRQPAAQAAARDTLAAVGMAGQRPGAGQAGASCRVLGGWPQPLTATMICTAPAARPRPTPTRQASP